MQNNAARSFTSGIPREVIHLKVQGATFFSSAASKKGPVGFRRKLQILVLSHVLKTPLPGGALKHRFRRKSGYPFPFIARSGYPFFFSGANQGTHVYSLTNLGSFFCFMTQSGYPFFLLSSKSGYPRLLSEKFRVLFWLHDAIRVPLSVHGLLQKRDRSDFEENCNFYIRVIY